MATNIDKIWRLGIHREEGQMKIYEGKTKDVYQLDEHRLLLQMKDQVTGKDGKFDPGENQVGLAMTGFGACSLKLSVYFFKLLETAGIPTHFISGDLEKNTMTVDKAVFFGSGLEVIVRRKAVGSFYKRYQSVVAEGEELDYLVEFTLKDDAHQDPLINKDALLMLGVLSESNYVQIKKLAIQITQIIEKEMLDATMVLYDIKYEFGMVGDKLVLIDEISPGNMRLYHQGDFVMPLEVCKRFFKKS